MTREEKILEILKNKIELSLTDNYKSVYIDGLEKTTEEIASLPFDVPTLSDINDLADTNAIREDSNGQKHINEDYSEGFTDGAEWAISEILKRNK
jgi:hypothetical protein